MASLDAPLQTRPGPFSSHYRRYWLPDLVAVVSLILATTILFWLTPLDLKVSSFFYQSAGIPQKWPYQNFFLWRLLNRSDAFLTYFLAISALLLLIVGLLWKARRHFMICGLFVLLSLVIGPGIIVNHMFKDHWGRPRPREVLQFSGNRAYAPILQKNEAGEGKSFPSGHASVAFAYGVFWFIWRRHRIRAALSLLGALLLGALVGVARMTAGAHFLSDVLWSFYLTFLCSLILYHFVLRIPVREDHWICAKS